MHPEGEQGRAEGPEPGPEREVPLVTREIAAEAAVWIARLHGPDRSNLMERECRAWQARSAANRLAFERATDLWMDVAGVNRAAVARTAAAREPDRLVTARRSRRWPVAVALSTIVLAGVLAAGFWRAGDIYDTGIGEQRIVMLQDGTRMSLNTSTRVRVTLGSSRRTLDVEGGEALFEVAKDAGRPFVVRAAGTEVTATGTAFVVRYTPAVQTSSEAVAVTLVEGRVVVRSTAGGNASPAPPIEMSPGERLQVTSRLHARAGQAQTPAVDRPSVDQVLAWKRGKAVFDNTSLPEAVAEMNRYSTTPISLVGLGPLASLRISGDFKTGDNASFARAVASMHGLGVQDRQGRLELSPK